jgi:integrase
MRGDGGIYRPKDRSSWYCSVPAKPKRAVRGPFKTEKEATAAWKALRKEIAAGRYRGPGEERLTVGELLDAYRTDLVTRGAKSMVSYDAHAKAVRDALGHMKAVEVDAHTINRVRQEWLEKGTPTGKKKKLRKKAEATTDRYLETLRAAYRLAVKQKLIGYDRVPYVDLIRPNNRRTGFVDEAVFWKLHEALSPSPVHADVALFAYRSGWRRGEVEGMTWEQVDLSARECRLWDSKNGRGRVLPLEGELWDVVERRQAARRYETKSGPALSAFVFHEAGAPLGDWRKRWASACKVAEVPGLIFHDFRRSAVRNLTRAGVASVVAMEITGHRTRSVFDRYNIATTDEAREAIRATVRFLKGKATGSATEKA